MRLPSSAAWPTRPWPNRQTFATCLALLVRVAREQAEHLTLVVGLRHVERAVVGVHERRELVEDLARDRQQVALALQHAGEPRDVRLEPVLLLVDLRGLRERADHLVDGVLELRDLAARFDGDRPGQVTLRHGGRDVADRADLVGQVAGELVDVVRQVAPHAGGARHVGLATEASVDADVAGDTGDLLGERRQRVDHVVDRVDQRRDLTAGGEVQLAIEVAVGDRGHDRRDAAHLLGEVARHDVHVVGQLAPRAGHAADFGLATEDALETDLARDARHLGCERAELIDHRVDRVLQLEQLAADLDGDLPGQVAVRDGGRHVGDVAHLVGQVRRHLVDVVGQLLPRAGDAAHRRLAAELAFDADVARDARHLVGERRQRVDHRVDDVLEVEQLAADLDRDLARHVAARDRGRDGRDVADLVGQVRRHLVDVVGQLLPRAADAFDRRLAAELALGADLASDARHLVGERATADRPSC